MNHSEIINYVINQIEKNGRSLNSEHRCVYLSPEGNRCGHSICIQDDIVVEISKDYNTHTSYKIITIYGDDIHKTEFRGKTGEFWRSIQTLHDNPVNWDGKELSSFGKEYVCSLIKKYNDY